jgi:cobalamin-dependent methionine synthase I
VPCEQNGLKEHAMSPSTRYAKKQAKARQRRRLPAHERLERDRCQAQRARLESYAQERLKDAQALRVLPTSLRELRFSRAYSLPY